MKTSFRVVFHAEDVKDQNRSALDCQLICYFCRKVGGVDFQLTKISGAVDQEI